MANSIKVDLTENNVELIRSATKEAITKALEAVGMQAENYAKEKCPVDTGRLRNSITHAQEGEDTEMIGTNVEYAPYVEYGTIHYPTARPFIKPAATEHTEEYTNIIKEILMNA